MDEKDRYWALQTLWWVLNEYSRLLAPFVPFIAEEIYTNITNDESVHLAVWPAFGGELINRKLNEEKGTNYKSLKIIPKSDAELELYCSNWDSEV